MADYSTRRLFKYIVLKLKSFFVAKDVLSFLVFLLFSATFWFVNALNKERELSLTFPIEYSGVPQNLMFEQELPVELELKIKDLGLNLWSYFGRKRGAVIVKFDQRVREKGVFAVSNMDLRSLVSERLLPSTAILLITPENIKSNYVKLHTKKLPVRFISDITLENQFMFCKPIKFFPEVVEVYGPSEVLDTLKEVKTENFVLKALNDTLTKTVLLKPIESTIFSVDEVTVFVCAERFTEKTVSLPVQIINNPDNLTILSFPAVVKVVFNIGVRNYKSFTNDDIQIVIDFKDIKRGDLSKKKLKIINNKTYISNIRIQPEEVEFLFEAK